MSWRWRAAATSSRSSPARTRATVGRTSSSGTWSTGGVHKLGRHTDALLLGGPLDRQRHHRHRGRERPGALARLHGRQPPRLDPLHGDADAADRAAARVQGGRRRRAAADRARHRLGVGAALRRRLDRQGALVRRPPPYTWQAPGRGDEPDRRTARQVAVFVRGGKCYVLCPRGAVLQTYTFRPGAVQEFALGGRGLVVQLPGGKIEVHNGARVQRFSIPARREDARLRREHPPLPPRRHAPRRGFSSAGRTRPCGLRCSARSSTNGLSYALGYQRRLDRLGDADLADQPATLERGHAHLPEVVDQPVTLDDVRRATALGEPLERRDRPELLDPVDQELVRSVAPGEGQVLPVR